MVYTFTLLNNNDPDMNFDVAEIDETSAGTNYNFTIHIVDVNLTTTDAVGFELGPVEHEL